jgi:choline-glycine betaine transporter
VSGGGWNSCPSCWYAVPRLAIGLLVAALGRTADVTEALTALLQQAQHAGAVRRDIDVRDVIALLAGASQAHRYAPDDRPLAVILDGLRVPIAQ